MTQKALKAKWGSPDKPLVIGNRKIQCYVLENGTRVLSGRGMQEAIGLGQSHGTLLRSFVNQKVLKPYINNELAMELKMPLRFIRPGKGGKPALAYEATILPKICDAILDARDKLKDKLTPRQKRIAYQCELLTRALSRVGIIALVDEVTGYQKIRDRDELNKILEAYIAKELLPWTKRFPDEFYKQLFRLRGWRYSPLTVKRPQYVGKLTDKLVYKKLPPKVLGELRKKNPKTSKGYRKHRHHQFLTEDIGNSHLERHIASITTLMRAASNWRNFERLFQRAFPSGPQQIEMAFMEEID